MKVNSDRFGIRADVLFMQNGENLAIDDETIRIPKKGRMVVHVRNLGADEIRAWVILENDEMRPEDALSIGAHSSGPCIISVPNAQEGTLRCFLKNTQGITSVSVRFMQGREQPVRAPRLSDVVSC